MYQTYSSSRSMRAVVFNTEEYQRTCMRSGKRLVAELYSTYIRPGTFYAYQHMQTETTDETGNAMSTLQIEAAIIVTLSIGFFFVMWLPYIHTKKQDVSLYSAQRRGIVDKTADADHVPAGGDDREGEGAARVLRQHPLQAEDVV
ncbi:MAG: hypothetical protein P4M11_11130 [Candidatus Pacebacteria bacterium]|nr:hypothetical protein [Candidatus Paceibacterota bacterium]